MSDQPKINRTRDELTSNEVPIFDSLSKQEFVDKVVDFLALEENKGKDRFRPPIMTLFKV
jgi:proteasome activator subunit 4